MSQRCILCEDPQIQFHWCAGLVRLDVLPGASGDAVIVIDDHTFTADEVRELLEKLGEAVAVCDRANGVTW